MLHPNGTSSNFDINVNKAKRTQWSASHRIEQILFKAIGWMSVKDIRPNSRQDGALSTVSMERCAKQAIYAGRQNRARRLVPEHNKMIKNVLPLQFEPMKTIELIHHFKISQGTA